MMREGSAVQLKDSRPMLGPPPQASPEIIPQPWDGEASVPKHGVARKPLMESTGCNLPAFAPHGTSWRVKSNATAEVEPHKGGEKDHMSSSAPF